MSESTDLIATAKKVDVMYQMRIQKERFGDRLDDYEKAKEVHNQSICDGCFARYSLRCTLCQESMRLT